MSDFHSEVAISVNERRANQKVVMIQAVAEGLRKLPFDVGRELITGHVNVTFDLESSLEPFRRGGF